MLIIRMSGDKIKKKVIFKQNFSEVAKLGMNMKKIISLNYLLIV